MFRIVLSRGLKNVPSNIVNHNGTEKSLQNSSKGASDNLESSFQNIRQFSRQKLENNCRIAICAKWIQIKKILWIPKMKFEKTADGIVPSFHKNVADNTVKIEI